MNQRMLLTRLGRVALIGGLALSGYCCQRFGGEWQSYVLGQLVTLATVLAVRQFHRWPKWVWPVGGDATWVATAIDLDPSKRNLDPSKRNCDQTDLTFCADLTALAADQANAVATENGSQPPVTIKLVQQADCERLIADLAQRIRRSLNVQDIFNTTVVEVQQVLQTDRVWVYQFHADWSGTVAVEAVAPNISPQLGQTINAPCIKTLWAANPAQCRITTIDDLHRQSLPLCYVEHLSSLQIRAILAVPILVNSQCREFAQVELSEATEMPQLWGLLIAHHCTTARHWQTWETALLQQLATQVGIAIQQSRLLEETQQQTQRQQAVNRVVQAIRNSLELEVVFSTATIEIARLLNVQRSEIVQYRPDRQCWTVVADYRTNPQSPSALGIEISDVGNPVAARVKQRQITYIEEGSTHADETDCELAKIAPGTWLVVPLHFSNTVWGTLSLLKPCQMSAWQPREVDIACEVADQLAIAIQQSELYQQVQQLNTRLEKLVNERTTQLQEALNYEAILKRITDKVRDSLDEHQILQTAVQELTLLAMVDACHAYLHSLNQTAPTHYEYLCDRRSLFAISALRGLPEVSHQLAAVRYFQFCPLPDAAESAIVPISATRVSLLACPITDDERILGDLWLVKPPDCSFDHLEIRVVQQVANQCAISLRQSRLYQAAQAQVEELERLNHLKDDFLNTVSHELRTPMSSIKMATQMLELLLFRTDADCAAVSPGAAIAADSNSASAGIQTNALAKAAYYFQILQEECDREISLINDLLNLSRLEADTEPLTLTTISPNLWLTHIVEPFLERAKCQQQQLQVHVSADLPPLTTELSSLSRILTELLNNACKYTPIHGTITLSAQTISNPVAAAAAFPTPHLQIRVCNSGVEIPAAELPHIFDKFYRVPNTDPWKHSGTGLGLALVKRLVAHLGGTIQVESDHDLTCFTIALAGPN